SLPVGELPASVRCEEGCDIYCGTGATCIMRDGDAHCVCPESQVYDAKEQQCRDVWVAGSCIGKECPTNAKCQTGDPSTCVCNDGFEMNKDETHCIALTCEELACPTNSKCDDTDIPRKCLCNEGFKMNDKHCIPLTCEDLACPPHSSCNDKDKPPQCSCNEGFKMENKQCIRKPLHPFPHPPCELRSGVSNRDV
ncbi:unnamed protein product, partial [Closterium sp. NIES-53]